MADNQSGQVKDPDGDRDSGYALKKLSDNVLNDY